MTESGGKIYCTPCRSGQPAGRGRPRLEDVGVLRLLTPTTRRRGSETAGPKLLCGPDASSVPMFTVKILGGWARPSRSAANVVRAAGWAEQSESPYA